MTASEFRELALALPGVVEGANMGHADFRAHGRIFATLGHPDDGWGMVKVPPPGQKELLLTHPHIFVPAKGAWGLQGCTLVRLEKANEELLRAPLDLAWQHSQVSPAKVPRTPRKKPAGSGSRRSA